MEERRERDFNKRLRVVVEERQKLQALVGTRATASRDRRKLLLGFGEFFDQVYLYFLSSQHSAYPVGALALALEQRSPNQRIHSKTAKMGMRILVDAIPEWCQLNTINGELRFVVFAKQKKLKPSVLRAKVVQRANELLLLQMGEEADDDDNDDEKDPAQ